MNWKRVQASREAARGLLALAVTLIVLAVFLAFTAPLSRGGLFHREPETIASIPISTSVFGVALGAMLIGLAWMWRIYRAPSRYDRAIWRYRDH